MDLSGHEGDIPIPIPISSTYGGGGGVQNIQDNNNSSSNIINNINNNNNNNGPLPLTIEEHHHHHHHQNKKGVVVKYRECLKNHAASIGGNATDGCGEFMPSGEEGTIEALKCSACNCHRNFHRKEIEGELPPSSSCECYHHYRSMKVVNHHPHHQQHHKGVLIPRPSPHQMIMPLGAVVQTSESDDMEGVLARPQIVKKRFRTKFTPEQKEKMLSFAEKVGWRLQKQEESVVQQFCQEIGVKRRVLKVWMHNNKHNLAKKLAPLQLQ
ncbi:Homeodomain ZF-HD class domain-containing protein [Dioscorea alata]|uniref:Homeodomain ZF-HD class domain-containing protein n=1 Tax=Dioscorea alata TaxID=55571 RepID=A0ACB7VAZ3_DIOAL|nr:Homeodomain ZF-HD class domain-containing protein [Dioscorea alata]